jgi:hypothetical protein
LNLHYAFAIGRNTDQPLGQTYKNDINYFVNSLVATYQINKKWKYIFDWSLKNVNDDYDKAPLLGEDYGDEMRRTMYYGINNELIYQYNSKWAFGVRAGWVHNGNSYHDEDPNFNGDYHEWSYGNKYTFSIGANWTPTKWLIVKPELRYDVFDLVRWGVDDQKYSFQPTPFDRETKKDQLSGGISAIVKF